MDDGEVVVLAVNTDGEGEEVYEIVEDEKLAQEVFEEFLLILDSDEEES